MSYSTIIGYCVIFLGALCVLWPQLLRRWAVGRISWLVFWAVAGALFYPSGSWAGSQWGVKGWLAAGVAFLFAGSLLHTFLAKAAERIPLVYFRILAVASIAAGLYLAFFKN